MTPDRQAAWLCCLVAFACFGWGACGMLPDPVEPEPQPPAPDPGPPTGTPCERACVRYAELACTPVLELPECAAECDKMEAFAVETGAKIGWNPECQAGAADCAAWDACRGDGT